jgi:hypothetical protein
MSTELVNHASPEESVLAYRLAQAYRDAIAVYQRDAETDAAAAAALDRAASHGAAQRVLTAPPDDVSWRELGQAMEQDPAAAQPAWARLQALATDELASGHRAARALGETTPMERARFLALLASYREAWVPQGGVEESLIASMAQAYMAYEFWLARVQEAATQEAAVQTERLRASGYWRCPPVDLAAALEQAASMAERFHRMYLRSVRALRDLRRYGPTVIVQNASQVNIGEQQVNVADKQLNVGHE